MVFYRLQGKEQFATWGDFSGKPSSGKQIKDRMQYSDIKEDISAALTAVWKTRSNRTSSLEAVAKNPSNK